ncbi:MAG: esterase [Acidobacteriota bacterium]|nr:MAG: esterase [Acidobacteriota bacterium]
MARFALRLKRSLLFVLIGALLSLPTLAQMPGAQGPQINSPEVLSGGRITFRILAPNAAKVLLGGTDIPGIFPGKPLTEGEQGVWEITVGPLEPGAYRYNFNVDGVPVIDPRNPVTSESNENTWSMVYLDGADFMETKQVPHGAVSEVTYYSTTLKRFRRAHVYTPPGYESGEGRFPVFYLLHGAFDCDDSWSTVGRAGFILDNLIAEKKAKPMVVVMPDGHTGPFAFGSPLPVDEFLNDFRTDLKPLVEQSYRVYTDRQNRAMAGLSMGGAHTLGIAIPDLEEYAYIGVFSSGIFGIAGGPRAPEGPSFEEINQEILQNNDLKKGLRLFWFATGKDDFLVRTSRMTVEMFKKYGFDVIYKETEGAHTWDNWRKYLNEFAPQLFQ